MASANVVSGNVRGGIPVLSSDFASQLVATGNASASIAAGKVVKVTALDGAIWVGIGQAATDPRVLLGAIGNSIDLHMLVAGTINILNAP